MSSAKIINLIKDYRLLKQISEEQEKRLLKKIDDFSQRVSKLSVCYSYKDLIDTVQVFYTEYFYYFQQRNYNVETKLLYEIHEYFYLKALRILHERKDENKIAKIRREKIEINNT